MSKPITKSQFMLFMTHPRLFWDARHNPEGLPPEDPMMKNLGEQGEGVEVLARQRYPGGVMMDFFGGDLKQTHRESLEITQSNAPAIFQPTFEANGLMARADVLYKDPDGEGWVLQEIKASSPPAKAKHVTDAAFQLKVLREAGVKVNKVELLLLNREYRRDGALDPERMFLPIDITDHAEGMQREIDMAVQEAKEIDLANEAPDVMLHDPRVANLSDKELDHYAPHLREHGSVLWLPKSSGGRKFNLELARALDEKYENISVNLLDDAVMNMTNDNGERPSNPENNGDEGGKKNNDKKGAKKGVGSKIQAAHRVSTLTNSVVYDSENLKTFLDTIKFPVVFLDFETDLAALPPYDGCRPNEQIPFLVSMIRIDSPEAAPVETITTVAPNMGDPRQKIVDSMLKETSGAACVIAYNASFEKTVIKWLAEGQSPKKSAELIQLNEKFIDIADPFRKGDIYHHQQRGKTGLKTATDTFLKSNPYQGLEVTNGAMAATAYRQAGDGDDQAWASQPAVQEYARVDVLAMLELAHAIERFSGKPEQEQVFKRHVSIEPRDFGRKIFDADPRTVIASLDKVEIENLPCTLAKDNQESRRTNETPPPPLPRAERRTEVLPKQARETGVEPRAGVGVARVVDGGGR